MNIRLGAALAALITLTVVGCNRQPTDTSTAAGDIASAPPGAGPTTGTTTPTGPGGTTSGAPSQAASPASR